MNAYDTWADILKNPKKHTQTPDDDGEPYVLIDGLRFKIAHKGTTLSEEQHNCVLKAKANADETPALIEAKSVDVSYGVRKISPQHSDNPYYKIYGGELFQSYIDVRKASDARTSHNKLPIHTARDIANGVLSSAPKKGRWVDFDNFPPGSKHPIICVRYLHSVMRNKGAPKACSKKKHTTEQGVVTIDKVLDAHRQKNDDETSETETRRLEKQSEEKQSKADVSCRPTAKSSTKESLYEARAARDVRKFVVETGDRRVHVPDIFDIEDPAQYVAQVITKQERGASLDKDERQSSLTTLSEKRARSISPDQEADVDLSSDPVIQKMTEVLGRTPAEGKSVRTKKRKASPLKKCTEQNVDIATGIAREEILSYIRSEFDKRAEFEKRQSIETRDLHTKLQDIRSAIDAVSKKRRKSKRSDSSKRNKI
ncbi:hypothetical protein CYMTET_35676 [Cymbomonas tetramitiformis]|uniref:Uncharacterized protein n=1 Tax=Cymbomonas tetramitiformis TaxID=36881 RepID=A0AAE0F8V7_9CHLO|nr:hypothetical protein CYMTET_35676 [Cymbomonas tetramitiformis]|eukprot:gene298-554_t